MPLYEYHCTDCDKAHELLVRGSESEGPVCPECGSQRLNKLLSVCATPSSGAADPAPPPGPCGSACGCFPQG